MTDENVERRQARRRVLPAGRDLAGRGLRRVTDTSPSTAGSPSSPAPAPGSAAPRPWRWPTPARASCSTTCRARADEAAEAIRARGGEATVVAGDVGERATADALMAATVDDLGRLDIVVNNAGITRDRMLFNMSDEEWDLVLRVHLRGHFLLSRNAAAYWRALSKETGGAGLRPHRQHLLRGVPVRLARASPTTPPPRPASPR